MTLKALLLAAAHEHGSQAALARFIGISPTRLSQLINGERHLTIRQAQLIATALGADAEVLWDESCIARGRAAFAKARRAK